MLDDMTFAQLRTFACAARTASFTIAADQLNITPPSVSEQIKTLESRLGCRLFRRRSGTTPVLTVEGEEALVEVEAILAASENLIELCRKSVKKTDLTLAVGPYLRENYVRRIIPRIYREYPNVQLDLQPLGTPAEMSRLIESGDLDLAIFTEPVYPNSITSNAAPYTRRICQLLAVVIAPPGTRARLLAGECALEDFRFIFPGPRNGARARWVRQRLREIKVTPRLPSMFIEFIDGLADMVEEGQGLGLTMEYAVADRIAAGRLEILDIPLPHMRRLIARSPHAPEEAKVIEDLLCDVLAVE